ncbi:MAG: hypothetical protein JJ858_00495 [Rhizobiaceae bacterium]|nr:hypothetical protein [Rhizobiaceae bacterium]
MRLILTVLLILISSSPSRTAEFTAIDDDLYHCKFLMEGTIEKGDAEKLQRVIDTQEIKMYPTPNNGYPDRLCLNSPGGNLLEAIKMAQMFTRNGGTAVRANERCESSCAILFMSGSFIGEDGIFAGVDRIIHPTAKLGFHSPSLEIPEGNYEKAAVDKAYKIALAGAAKINGISNSIDIPVTLVTELLNTPSDSMLYVDKVWKAVRWGINVGPTKEHLPINRSGYVAACNNVIERSLENNIRTSFGRGSVFSSDERIGWTGGDILNVARKGDKIEVYFSALTYLEDDCYLKLPASMEEIRTLSTTPDGLSVGANQADDFVTTALIFFNGSTNLADIAPRPNQVTTQSAAVTNDNDHLGMKHFPAFDLKGGDISINRGISQEACLAQCNRQGNCTALTYDSWNNICILKDFRTSSKTMLMQPKSHTYINAASTSEISYSQSKPTFKRRDDRHFPAKAYSVVIQGDREACQSECASDNQCQAYAYAKYLSECELYNLPPEYFPKSGSYIGVKEQLK